VKASSHQQWVERLVNAAQSGALLDLADGLPSDPGTVDSWNHERTLPAAPLREVLIRADLAFDPRGLRIRGARITGDLDLAYITFSHPLELIECDIQGDINMNYATLKALRFTGTRTRTLGLDGAHISGDLYADEGFKTYGQFRAPGAHIGGRLRMNGATLTSPDGYALILDFVEISGGLSADISFNTHGEFRAPNAHIGGELRMNGATLTNPSGDALLLDTADITRVMLAMDGFRTEGTFRARGAHFGELNLSGATLSNPDGYAIDLDGAEIAADMIARDGFRTEGNIRAVGARIGDDLTLSGATLTNPDGYALLLDRTEIGRNLFARGSTAEGIVRAASARIGGDLILSGATLSNRDGDALDLEGTEIKGSLICDDADVDGIIDLRRAIIGDLVTPEAGSAPGLLVATGWEIRDLHGRLRNDWRAAHRWLKTAPHSQQSVQPWHALAAVYERNGQPTDGRRLRLAAANRVTSNAPWPAKVGRTIYLCVVGHGYYPLLAGLWLALVVLAGSLIVASYRADFVPTNSDAANNATLAHDQLTHNTTPVPITAETPCAAHPNYPCLNPFTYTLSALVPSVGTTTTEWAIRSNAALAPTVALPLLKLTAWALTALLLAGVTGLLRKT
jgi:hypothetical protein